MFQYLKNHAEAYISYGLICKLQGMRTQAIYHVVHRRNAAEAEIIDLRTKMTGYCGRLNRLEDRLETNEKENANLKDSLSKAEGEIQELKRLMRNDLDDGK